MGERGTEELRTTEWLFALFSLACYVSFVSSVLTGASSSFPATGRYPPTWGVQVTLLVGLSFFGTVLFLRTRSLTLRCLVLASQTFFLLILLIPAQGGLTGVSARAILSQHPAVFFAC